MTSQTVPALTQSKVSKFQKWLSSRGAEVLATTNPYEVVRFRAGSDTHVIYKNDRGKHTAINGTAEILRAWQTSGEWKAPEVKKRRGTGLVRKYFDSLVERDGQNCFFCKGHVSELGASVEHLVPVAHGGPNHMSNFVLAHAECNRRAGHLSAAEKIKMRESQ